MNMGEYGGRLQRIGLANLQAMADIENRRLWDNVEQGQQESEAKNSAIGSLIGNVAGLGMAGYSEYKRAQEGTPKGIAEGTVNASREHQANKQAYDQAGIAGQSAGVRSGIESVAASEPMPQFKKTPGQYGMQDVSSERIKPIGPDYADYQLQDKDRRIVAMRSPTRSRLASTWNDTSDGFKSAFNSLLSGFPSNIIG